MAQKRKYGSAERWFGYGVALLVLGSGTFGGSFAPDGVLADFELPFRVSGAVAALIGMGLIVFGIRVWRYNLKHDETPSAVVVGTSSPKEDRWAELTKRRDELEVELAGLQAQVYGSIFALSSLIANSPQDIERRASEARAKKRTEQVDAEIAAINFELRARVKSMKD